MLQIFLSLTESPGKDVITTHIQGQTSTGQECHVWTQILDCKDGSFIIRYKLHNTCFNLKLQIKIKQYNSPILLIESKGINSDKSVTSIYYLFFT